MVREGGVEPPYQRRWFLRPVRLPIPPLSLEHGKITNFRVTVKDGLRSCPDLKQIFPDMTGAKTFFPRASAVKTLPAAHAAPCISMPENYSQLHLTSRRKKWFIEKINISSSRNTVQIRGDPIAVIGDAGLHRDFPGHSQIVLRGEGRRPADDPKARRPDAHVFYGRCCRASGYSHGNRTRSDSPWSCSGFFYS